MPFRQSVHCRGILAREQVTSSYCWSIPSPKPEPLLRRHSVRPNFWCQQTIGIDFICLCCDWMSKQKSRTIGMHLNKYQNLVRFQILSINSVQMLSQINNFQYIPEKHSKQFKKSKQFFNRDSKLNASKNDK